MDWFQPRKALKNSADSADSHGVFTMGILWDFPGFTMVSAPAPRHCCQEHGAGAEQGGVELREPRGLMVTCYNML